MKMLRASTARLSSPSQYVVIMLGLCLCACSYNPPRAWERGHLAKPAMQMLADPLETSLLDQMHASKEGASGGASVGGGGCGCN